MLVVDDDPDVHDTTRLALDGVTILDRPLLLLHAFTAATAVELLRKDRAVAVVLLDVVMETPTAGLTIIAKIREELGLHDTRIILRTGQPGYAPEHETVRRYDINDYHNKGELTRDRLYVALSTALRAYDQLARVAALSERLENQAYFDALVDLPNRNAFIEAIDRRVAASGSQDNVLALIDIDEFAEINDMFGHGYADRLLAAIARRIEHSMDHEEGSVLIARVGTDTFGVFGRADLLSPRLLQAIFAAPFALDDSEHTVSVAVGLVRLAEIPDGGAADRLKDASLALKRAKASGHGQSAWFTPAIGHETRERTRLLHALRRAYDHEHLFPVYQPQFCLATGRIVGFEAL
ncbi:MAG: diguanylate cyclase, partial [Rhodocyclaceae bacterium]|nr:diguanylate cyclase [Rhodocyclaceae bacterium]